MAKSFVGSNKANNSESKSNNNVKIRSNANLMSSSMPSSVLSKTLYSNVSTTNQRNNNATSHGSKPIISKRNHVSKARQNPPDGGKKILKSTRDNQVSVVLIQSLFKCSDIKQNTCNYCTDGISQYSYYIIILEFVERSCKILWKQGNACIIF